MRSTSTNAHEPLDRCEEAEEALVSRRRLGDFIEGTRIGSYDGPGDLVNNRSGAEIGQMWKEGKRERR